MTETSSSNQECEAQTQRNLMHRILGAVVGLIATTMPSTSSFRSLGGLLLLVVAPLLVGWWLAQGLVPQPVVGIIRLNSDIWAGSARLAMAQIEAARQDPSIKAVVLQLDSPGGEVAATQALYLELLGLRREMPVVSSWVDLSQGLVYSGRESLRLGLIDHLGSQTDAVATAAELASIVHHEVIDPEARVIDELLEDKELSLETWAGAADPVTERRVLPPGAYLLYDIQLGGAP